MSTVTKLKRLTVEEYLELEKQSDVRHEYVAGVLYAMVGASAAHNQITITLAGILYSHLKGSPCRVFQSDMKVRVENVIYYPDLMVTCEKFDPKAYYQTEPKLIIEVLSESTKAKDHLEKLVAYQKLPSLQEYALVSQDKKHIEIIRRIGHEWQREVYSDVEKVKFTSVDLELPIDSIYGDLTEYLRKP